MLSIMQIDGLAKRYGKLPNEILREANTFDLYIIDAAMTYEQYHHKKAMNKGQDPIDHYTTDDLLKIYNKGKENNGPRNTKTS
jgi:hypothetical protein